MKIDMSHARAKTLAKTLRSDLGPAAPSYQRTLDLLARGFGYATYEAMKTAMDAADSAPEAAASHTPAQHAAQTQSAQDAAYKPDPIPEVAVLYIAPADRPDGLESDQPVLHVGQDKPAAEAALNTWLDAVGADRRAGDPPYRVFQLPLHDRTSALSVGRHGEALPATPTGQPENLFYKNMDPVMDGTTLYDRPTYYACGICEAYHPADWNGDCRDDNNRFWPDQLDARHGEHGWEEIDMPGTEDAAQQVDLTHPRRGTEIRMGVCRFPEEGLTRAAARRLDADGEALAFQYTYVPIPADPEEEPRWLLNRLDERGLELLEDESADGVHATEAALGPDERNSLVWLHEALTEVLDLGPDTAISVHIDRHRVFAFPTAGGIDHYVENADPVLAAALYQERDDQQRTLEETPRDLIDLIQDLAEIP